MELTPWRYMIVAAVLVIGLRCGEGSETGKDGERAVDLLSLIASGGNLYSQWNEELIIRDFFQDRREGFFLDVGCYLPDESSTTYYLEKHLGWTGFGIDALPELGPAWEEMRPGSKFFNYAVTDTSGEVVTLFRKTGEPGLSSLSEDMVRNWGGRDLEEIEVSTITLTKLLDDNGISEIDFLSMDIEGAEPMALAGFDIERFEPELICIEAHASDENEKFILDYFESHGYELIEEYIPHDFVNWYFRPKEWPGL